MELPGCLWTLLIVKFVMITHATADLPHYSLDTQETTHSSEGKVTANLNFSKIEG